MSELNEDKVNNEIVIDFHQLRNPELRESFLSAFGHMIKGLLGSIFGPNEPPRTRIMGKPAEVHAFAQAQKMKEDILRVYKDMIWTTPELTKTRPS